MLLVGQLAKVQGLKGEFLLHSLMDEPDRLEAMEGLFLAPPEQDLESATPEAPARAVRLRSFRWHQDRPCVAFQGLLDRTAAEAFKGWALWMPEASAVLEAGQTFRHEWIGCDVFVAGHRVGEVLRLDPSPAGYDMVVMKELRPGRTGLREVPYIKAWWTLDLEHRRLELDPPEGLLDINQAGGGL
jgi:16S rRNA processing protein RimM